MGSVFGMWILFDFHGGKNSDFYLWVSSLFCFVLMCATPRSGVFFIQSSVDFGFSLTAIGLVFSWAPLDSFLSRSLFSRAPCWIWFGLGSYLVFLGVGRSDLISLALQLFFEEESCLNFICRSSGSHVDFPSVVFLCMDPVLPTVLAGWFDFLLRFVLVAAKAPGFAFLLRQVRPLPNFISRAPVWKLSLFFIVAWACEGVKLFLADFGFACWLDPTPGFIISLPTRYWLRLSLPVRFQFAGHGVSLNCVWTFTVFPGFLTRFWGRIVFYSYVVLTELEEMRIRFDLEHRSSSLEEF
jgi:hypothetical protein